METGNGYCPAITAVSCKKTSYGKKKASFGPVSFRVLHVFAKKLISAYAVSWSSFGPFSFEESIWRLYFPVRRIFIRKRLLSQDNIFHFPFSFLHFRKMALGWLFYKPKYGFTISRNPFPFRAYKERPKGRIDAFESKIKNNIEKIRCKYRP